jgi:hypothetical protein
MEENIEDAQKIDPSTLAYCVDQGAQELDRFRWDLSDVERAKASLREDFGTEKKSSNPEFWMMLGVIAVTYGFLKPMLGSPGYDPVAIFGGVASFIFGASARQGKDDGYEQAAYLLATQTPTVRQISVEEVRMKKSHTTYIKFDDMPKKVVDWSRFEWRLAGQSQVLVFCDPSDPSYYLIKGSNGICLLRLR